MLQRERFLQIVNTYRQDPESVYQTWFTNNMDRLKAFRSIRQGVERVVKDVAEGGFPNDFRGSSLEFVLDCITEQKQIFEGAAHAFYWKPKLRIPDIYENEANKRAFAQFLRGTLNATREDQLLREITVLDRLQIKGLGPAVANILYFLHPTLMPPFNTAILNGFNRLFKTKNKLGSWSSYLEMRNTVIQANDELRTVLSKDLGALTGLLFEVGAGRLVIDENADLVLESERKKLEDVRRRRHIEVEEDLRENDAHTQMQYLLAKIGSALGYDVFVAVNDRSKRFGNQVLSDLCVSSLPPLEIADEVTSTIELIDVLWLEKTAPRIVCAFEVEKSTSIYSGILRLSDLALALPNHGSRLCLVAPNAREKEVVAQLKRPSFLASDRPRPSYLLFSDLSEHCDAICRFGADHTILDKIVKIVNA